MHAKDMPELTPAEIARFWSKPDRSGGPDACWPWRGKQSGQGYGTFALIRDGWSKHFIASRVAWTVANGREIPAGLVVRHTCDNPPCCNPAHLLIGTRRENIRDCIERGRYRGAGQPGVRHSKARLTEDDVRAIRALVAEGSVTSVAIARRYGVRPNTIYSLVSRKTWRHLD